MESYYKQILGKYGQGASSADDSISPEMSIVLEKFDKEIQSKFLTAHKELCQLAEKINATQEGDDDSKDVPVMSSAEGITGSAIVAIMMNLCNHLQILHCRLKKDATNIRNPHHIFSWSVSDFLQRTMLVNNNYVDEFVVAHGKHLNLTKAITDISTILGILNTWKIDIETSSSNFQASGNKLREILELLFLQANIIPASNYSNMMIEDLKETKTNTQQIRNDFEKLDVINFSEETTRQLILDQIKQRYLKSFEAARVEQFKLKMEQDENKFTNEANEYKDKYQFEEYCFESLQSSFERSIEHYKSKIDEIMQKYEEDFEKADLELSRTQGQIDSINANMKAMEDQIEYFKAEMKRHKEEKEREEAEKAWRDAIKANLETDNAQPSTTKTSKSKKDTKKKKKSKKGTKGKKV